MYGTSGTVGKAHSMRIQVYKTRKGAERYAAEIRAKFSSVTTEIVPAGFHGFAVLVKYPSGESGLAGKRPNGYQSMAMHIPGSA